MYLAEHLLCARAALSQARCPAPWGWRSGEDVTPTATDPKGEPASWDKGFEAPEKVTVMQGGWPGERDWGRGREWKWGSGGCSRETGACTPPLPAPVPGPVPTARRLAMEHSPAGPESTSSR